MGGKGVPAGSRRCSMCDTVFAVKAFTGSAHVCDRCIDQVDRLECPKCGEEKTARAFRSATACEACAKVDDDEARQAKAERKRQAKSRNQYPEGTRSSVWALGGGGVETKR